MKRLFCIITGLSFVALLTVGCAANPPGLGDPHALSDAEKQEAIQIALTTAQAKQRIGNLNPYVVADVGWAAIVWQGTGNPSWKWISSDWTTDPNRSLVPASAKYYINVQLSCSSLSSSMGWPPFYVDIDPDSGKVVLVQDNPFNDGNGPIHLVPNNPIPLVPVPSPPLN